jgi:pimeloyl-ACP methyl ester carboxylesterase
MQRHHAEVMMPAIARHNGRVVKLMGDGLLAEFASVVEAVLSAVEVQRAMRARNAELTDEARIEFRIAVHLCDIIIDGNDIHGDGVNIVSRLEAIAEVGGICVSGQAYDEVQPKLDLAFRALGPQTLKNIPRPVAAWAVELGDAAKPDPSAGVLEPHYSRTPDGVRLAYAIAGSGPNLVRAGRWFTHLEYDWANLQSAGSVYRDFRLLLYDARGTGMSDWEVDDISHAAWVRDLGTVVDAAGYDRFALLAESQGVSVAIAYAVAQPERVSKLILVGGYALGWRKRPGSNIEQHQAMTSLMRIGWGTDDPTFRQMFTSQFMPGGTKEEWDASNELQRVSASPDVAARFYEATGDIDVTGLLPEVKTPTLVMHVRGDLRAPFELGRQIAAGIPGARFVALPGNRHAFAAGSPAAERFVEEVRLFLAGEQK